MKTSDLYQESDFLTQFDPWTSDTYNYENLEGFSCSVEVIQVGTHDFAGSFELQVGSNDVFTTQETQTFDIPFVATYGTLTVQDLTFTAAAAGPLDSFTVEFVNPGDVDQPLTLVNNITDQVVYLATDGSGNITTTAQDIADAWALDITLLSYMSCAVTGTGSDIQVAAPAAYLTGGTNPNQISSLIFNVPATYTTQARIIYTSDEMNTGNGYAILRFYGKGCY